MYTYLKVNKSDIKLATPKGYNIVNIADRSSSDTSWNFFDSKDFVGDRSNPYLSSDFSIRWSENVDPEGLIDYEIHNPYSQFILKKSMSGWTSHNDGLTREKEVRNAFSISSKWDNTFPETIRLKYPGIININNSTQLTKFSESENYNFKILRSQYNRDPSGAWFISGNEDRRPDPNSYFYDLVQFIRANARSSYDEWLVRPTFSLKNLLTKTIQNDGKVFRLYRVDDVNVQSLSTGFDEYIPWCFDQNGRKIEQYKIALISSQNRKEIYILLELRKDDITIQGEGKDVNIFMPNIESIVFWRSGLIDYRMFTNYIRNVDTRFLVKWRPGGTNTISSISNYFREAQFYSDTMVSFQTTRENDTGYKYSFIENEEYNDDGLTKKRDYLSIDVKGNINFLTTGNLIDNNRIYIVNRTFPVILNDDHRHMVHVFINGKLIDYNDYYLQEGSVFLKNKMSGYLEVYANTNTSKTYWFHLNGQYRDISQDQLSNLLYRAGLPWKTNPTLSQRVYGEGETPEEEPEYDEFYTKGYILFKDGNYVDESKLHPDEENRSGDMLIIDGLDYEKNIDYNLPVPTTINPIDFDDSLKKPTKSKHSYNINYDPLLTDTSESAGNDLQYIDKLDMWIFDNTRNHIKIRESSGDEGRLQEPFLTVTSVDTDGVTNRVINVMGERDPLLSKLTDDSAIVKYDKDVSNTVSKALDGTTSIEVNNIFTNSLISEKDSDNFNWHYSQMSTINKNIINMFLYSHTINNNNNMMSKTGNDYDYWIKNEKNKELVINRDFTIVMSTNKDIYSNVNVIGDLYNYTDKDQSLTTLDPNRLSVRMDPISVRVNVDGSTSLVYLIVLHRSLNIGSDENKNYKYKYVFNDDVYFIEI